MPKRILHREFTGQHQDRPGFKYKMRPEPEIISRIKVAAMCTARLTRPDRATHGSLSSEIIKRPPEYTPESLNRECEIELHRHYDR